MVKRNDRIVALSRCHDIFGHPEADRVAQEVSHRLALCVDRRFRPAIAREPGAVNASENPHSPGPARAQTAVVHQRAGGGQNGGQSDHKLNGLGLRERPLLIFWTFPKNGNF